jgi:nitrogenase subunit NifH
MTTTMAILGKASVGKTFLAAHLGMAFGYLGEKTLVVGCDQKRDVSRALARETRPSLVEGLELVGYDYEALNLADLTTPVTENVDVLEMGPSQLLVGHYGSVLDEAFHVFDSRDVLAGYSRVLFDVTDERFDASFAPLLRRVEGAIGVTDDSPESLFVLNRLIRAVLIGSAEHGLSLKLVGVVHNRSINPRAFERYVERSHAFPMLTIPEATELAHLRQFHRTLFSLESLPPKLEPIVDGLIKIAELLRGRPFNLYPMLPLEDEEIWGLAPPVTLTS